MSLNVASLQTVFVQNHFLYNCCVIEFMFNTSITVTYLTLMYCSKTIGTFFSTFFIFIFYKLSFIVYYKIYLYYGTYGIHNMLLFSILLIKFE